MASFDDGGPPENQGRKIWTAPAIDQFEALGSIRKVASDKKARHTDAN